MQEIINLKYRNIIYLLQGGEKISSHVLKKNQHEI